MICGLASCKSRGKIRRKFDFNCFKVFPPRPVTHHHELQIPQKWPQAIFPRALTLIHLPCPWWSYHSFSICLRCWFFSACHSQLYTSQWKSSITAERCLQANIMCSSVWCKHPLQPSSIILPSKEKALSSHFHFCQMRSLHIKNWPLWTGCLYPLLFRDSFVCSDGQVGTNMATLLGWLLLAAHPVHTWYFRTILISLRDH